MPSFRGIEISIHASLEAKQVTEYPHPDGSSVRLMKAAALPVTSDTKSGIARATQSNDPPTVEDVDPTRLKKVNPRISVYIPSLPGEQFWLRYLITQSPAPSRCIFFKMTMNGRHVSSWGINTNTHSTGIVVRALYQPENTWEDTSGYSGAQYPGIETRYFHFMPGLDRKSAAEDGGIIEIQAFRCKGRKRIALELNAYRNQERYGIAFAIESSPSGGLVDNPEDATYYNYYLIDAKDAPYATFCFHYRSMKYLKQLNLAPQIRVDTSPASDGSPCMRRKGSTGPLRSDPISPLTGQFIFDADTPGSQILNGDIDTTRIEELIHAETNSQEGYFLQSPPNLTPSLSEATVTVTPGKASEMEQFDEIQHRPLPYVPRFQPRPASASSLRSNCPSLTPSLRRYVESDDFENEEIRLSTAQPMLISSESMQALELVDTGGEEGISFSDYASSPSSTEASDSPKLPSPAGYIPTTGSVLERHLTQFDSPRSRSSPMNAQDVLLHPITDSPEDNNEIEPRTSVLKLTESEWLRHSPSPLQREDKQAETLCSMRLELPMPGATGASGGSMTQKHHMDSPGQAPIGNWI